jgi:multidrug efflux pump
MNPSAPFIKRPVATTLLTLAIVLAGSVAYFLLPVAPLPEVEFPTISVSAGLPGAGPETMASSVAAPLERQFGRIAGVTEMTSSSSLGATSIVLQFDLNRNIDAAARDVQAAINAAAANLPANLPIKPTYRKVNPADAPILILALTSDIYDRGQMYDWASTVLAQKLSQVQGVGQVMVGGGASPAVRVEVNPMALSHLGLKLEDLRATLGAANANHPKGEIQNERYSWSLNTTDQLLKAKQYQSLVVSYHNGNPTRLSDVANVSDSVENVRAIGYANGKPAVLLIIFRQPGANIIKTVDRIFSFLPHLKASIPPSIGVSVVMDRTTTIRSSVRDVEFTLIASVCLVMLVVFFFLRDWKITMIPSVVVPVSLVGTFGIMYLLHYTIDNLSLMALTIATGFVVDDAIVVIENISRYLEQGFSPMEAALRGAKEIGFTVLSISVSLVAVFLPILLMGGIVGRLFREFSVVLAVAIGVSLIVSLTTTPMMCSLFLRHRKPNEHGKIYRASEKLFQAILNFYESTLRWVLRHELLMLFVTISTICFTVYLYAHVPKGFFPQQDTGRMMGAIQADQSTSYQAMKGLLFRFANATKQDPAVQTVVAFTGGDHTINTGRMFVTLKPMEERHLSVDRVIGRLRGKLAHIPGATLFFQPIQDLRIGGRLSHAQYQYTLQGESTEELSYWSAKLLEKLRTLKGLADVNTDQQDRGLEAWLDIDRTTASRLGLSSQAVDNVLYDAFGQRQVSTMYTGINQYHVVMEADPSFAQSPEALRYIYINSSNGTPVPLSAFTRYEQRPSPLEINHQGQFPAITFSFNLKPDFPLGQAVQEIERSVLDLRMPASVHGFFAGTAQAFQSSLGNQTLLIITALLAVYIVLGILYESLIHPITILSTLPSAGVGAILALMLCGMDLSIIALIGIILLIGIVKKNAIMMIDFALHLQKSQNASPEEAIFQACLLRFRPIMMTTAAALLGALPLALGIGTGAEIRQPLGVAIVGGLIFSQALTLYTTPVIYVFFDKLRIWLQGFQANKVMPESLENSQI